MSTSHLVADPSDNSEYFTRDDEILFKNTMEFERHSTTEGPTRTGLMGRITGNELMNRYR